MEVVRAREARKREQRAAGLAAAASAVPEFPATLREHGLELRRTATTTLQFNIGKLCNLVCRHCHVEAGPTKVVENADLRVVERVLETLRANPAIRTLDLTGGAPELNPHFRMLVAAARRLHVDVIDRCNLTVFTEPGQADLPSFLAAHAVHIVASLPCYTQDNVDKQRGKGTFDASVKSLQQLNALGYGKPGTGLKLSLVYNPGGASVPGAQAKLEADYKHQLRDNFDIVFNELFTITNVPIKRFADDLMASGKYSAYMSLLLQQFNAQTVPSLMCRNTLSVAWDGSLYDCDFNQALEMKLGADNEGKSSLPQSLFDIRDLSSLTGANIATAKHCYACTAGAGSSCGGALV